MKKEFIFGKHSVLNAIESGKIIDKIFLKNGLSNDTIKIIKNKIINKNITINYVPVEKLNRITNHNHQGVIALISCCKFYSIKEFLPKLIKNKKKVFLLLLDRVTDVRNFGALIRTAECVGIDAVIIGNISNAPLNLNTMKTSSGALNWIPICKENNLYQTIDFIQQMGISVIAASEKSKQSIFDIDIKFPTAVLFGNESKGINKQIFKRCDSSVKLPLYGKIQSLNISVACGSILYEIIRKNLN